MCQPLLLKPLGRDHRGHHHLRRPMSPCTQACRWAQHPMIPLFLGKNPIPHARTLQGHTHCPVPPALSQSCPC